MARAERAKSRILEPEQCDPYFWLGMVFAANGQVTEAEEMIDQALKLGLPPLLLTPLYWLQTDQPDFFVTYAKPKLEHYHLYFEGRG